MTDKIKVKIELRDDERQPVECWTRVMGYFRPVSGYNVGKKFEFDERKWFTEDSINDHTTGNSGAE